MTGKGIVRSVKNIARGYTDVQIKVREATSNDAWGPSGTLMNEIAQLTYNQHDFIEIMDMIDKRLNDKGKNWRHVFKALLLLDYCLHVGSDNVVLYAKENVYVVKTLKEFQHIDENGKDVGANVRQKAKDVSGLLTDDSRLKEERRQRQHMRDRMSNITDHLNYSISGPDSTNYGRAASGISRVDEEGEMRRAIEESKRMAEEEERKRQSAEEDANLNMALKLSVEEAEKEKKRREDKPKQLNLIDFGEAQSSSSNLFPFAQTSDAFGNPFALAQTSSDATSNPFLFQQQTTVPAFNPYSQQQQLPQQQTLQTMPVQHAQPQPQMQQQQPQQQPQQQQQQQSSPWMQTLQPQITGFEAFPNQQLASYQNTSNPYVNAQITGVSQPQTQLQLQPQVTGTPVMAGSKNPFSQYQSGNTV